MLSLYVVVYDVEGDIQMCLAMLSPNQVSVLSFKPSVAAVTSLDSIATLSHVSFDYLNDLEDDI